MLFLLGVLCLLCADLCCCCSIGSSCLLGGACEGGVWLCFFVGWLLWWFFFWVGFSLGEGGQCFCAVLCCF